MNSYDFSGTRHSRQTYHPLFRALPLFPLLVLLLLSACQQAPQAGECDPHVVWSQEPDGNILLVIDPENCLTGVTPTATALVVTDIPAPTSTPLPTATNIPPTATVNPTGVPAPVLLNGSFETRAPFGAVKPQYGLPEVNVMQGWVAYFCGTPYTQQNCRIPLEWNPYTAYMRRPEFKPANPDQDCLGPNQYANRVKRGCNAQQFFAFYGVMNAGVQQTVNTLIPGARYEFSAYVQLWSAENASGGCVARDTTNACIDRNADPYTSDIASQDDRTAINGKLGVDISCGTDAYSPSVQWTRDYNHSDGLYDHWGQIKITFTATSNCATLFAGGYNRYGKTHNDIFIDDARLVVVP